MSQHATLLSHLARTIAQRGVAGLTDLAAGDFLDEVTVAARAAWAGEQSQPDQRREVEALAQADAAEALQLAEKAVEAAGALPDEARRQLTAWLAQVPASIRRACRRAQQPDGRTLPGYLALSQADDLLPLLPTHLSRFHAGYRVPGTDWELVEPLGVGGFGEVWKARNLSRPTAAPQVFKFCTNVVAAQTLRNETDLFDRIAALGAQEGLVQLHETYLTTEPPCLRYEYVAGGELTALIREWHATETPSLATLLAAWRQIVGIVAVLHRAQPAPIVHRDLKPANILVHLDASGPRFKVADLGIGGLARYRPSGGSTRGAFLATALVGACSTLYASPEQMRGGAPDPRDDVYALGVILYQMLTGKLESAAPTGFKWAADLQAKYPTLDAGVVELLASCFNTAADRPAHAAALLTTPPPQPGLSRTPTAPPPTRAYPTAETIEATARQLPPSDDAAWEEANVRYRLEWFEAYLTTYPEGRHAEAARATVSQQLRALVVARPHDRTLRRRYLAKRSKKDARRDARPASPLYFMVNVTLVALVCASLSALLLPKLGLVTVPTAAAESWILAAFGFAVPLMFGCLFLSSYGQHRAKLQAVLGPLPSPLPATLDAARREFLGSD